MLHRRLLPISVPCRQMSETCISSGHFRLCLEILSIDFHALECSWQNSSNVGSKTQTPSHPILLRFGAKRTCAGINLSDCETNIKRSLHWSSQDKKPCQLFSPMKNPSWGVASISNCGIAPISHRSTLSFMGTCNQHVGI